jgi:hypothetical protein
MKLRLKWDWSHIKRKAEISGVEFTELGSGF